MVTVASDEVAARECPVRGTLVLAALVGKEAFLIDIAIISLPVGKDLQAAIGPNIGVCCFETHADVPDAVRAVLGAEAEGFIVPAGEKFRVDLKGVNAWLLRRAGVRDIEISCDCTACRPDRFWSHRRVGNDRGSLAAIIVCKGGKES